MLEIIFATFFDDIKSNREPIIWNRRDEDDEK